MAKKVTGYIKLQIPAAKATPAPPVLLTMPTMPVVLLL